MHPNSAFRAGDREAMLGFVEQIGFAHLFAATPAGAIVAHAPLTRFGDGFRFHLARANRLTPNLDGASMVASVAGAQGYISPSWYVGQRNQVPTWNYVAVEIEGVARALDDKALIEQLDRLAADHEPRVAPEAPWTRGKMDEAVFRKMLGAIQGFALEVTALRGTTKLSQNKAEADRAGAIAGLERSGNAGLAAAMRAG